ncbi:hypothetical protein MALU111345_16450 [Marinicrinis lubricantis]
MLRILTCVGIRYVDSIHTNPCVLLVIDVFAGTQRIQRYIFKEEFIPRGMQHVHAYGDGVFILLFIRSFFIQPVVWAF